MEVTVLVMERLSLSWSWLSDVTVIVMKVAVIVMERL